MRPTPRPTYRPCRTVGCPVLVRAPADHCPHHDSQHQADHEHDDRRPDARSDSEHLPA